MAHWNIWTDMSITLFLPIYLVVAPVIDEALTLFIDNIDKRLMKC